MFYVVSGSTVPYLKNIASFCFKPINDYGKIIKEINRIYEERINISNNNNEQNIKFTNENIGLFRRLLNSIRN